MKKVLMFQDLLFFCANHIPQSHQVKKIEGEKL